MLRKPRFLPVATIISFKDSSSQNDLLPPINNQPIDVQVYGAPQLVVEIASTTLKDNLGPKRLLYERLGVQEYWVVNVATSELVALTVANGGSREVRASQALPGLTLSMVET